MYFLGGISGAGLGVYLGLNGDMSNLLGSVFSFIFAIPVAIFVITGNINKNYGKYRLVLIEHKKPVTTEEEVIS